MFKGDDEMKKFFKKNWLFLLLAILFTVLLGILVSVAISIQKGMTANQSTIYAGFLGLIGGIIGAMSAFAVAQIQFNLQVEEQRKNNELKRKEQQEADGRRYEQQEATLNKQFIQQRYIVNSQFEQQKIILEEQMKEQHKLNLKKVKLEVEVNTIQNAIILISKIRNTVNNINDICLVLAKYENSSQLEKQNNQTLFESLKTKVIKEFNLLSDRVGDYISYFFLYEDKEFEDFYNNNLVDKMDLLNTKLNKLFDDKYIQNARIMIGCEETLLELKDNLEKELGKFNKLLIKKFE